MLSAGGTDPSGGQVMPDCERGKQPFQAAPELPWSGSAPNSIRGIFWCVGLLSLGQPFLPLPLNCLHQLISFLSILPVFWMVWKSVRHQSRKEWEGHPTANSWWTNQEDARPQFFSASSSSRDSLHIAKREAACMTSICVFGICVGVNSGKAGICQPLCRQLTYESSHPKWDMWKKM